MGGCEYRSPTTVDIDHPLVEMDLAEIAGRIQPFPAIISLMVGYALLTGLCNPPLIIDAYLHRCFGGSCVYPYLQPWRPPERAIMI